MKIEEISHENPATPSKKPSFHCEPFVIYILQHWYQIQHGPLFFDERFGQPFTFLGVCR